MNRIKKWLINRYLFDFNAEVEKHTLLLTKHYDREVEQIEPSVRLACHNNFVDFIRFARHYLDRTYSNTQLIWLSNVLILKKPENQSIMFRQEGKSTILGDFALYMLSKVMVDKNRDILIVGSGQRMLNHMREIINRGLERVLAQTITDKALHYQTYDATRFQPSDWEYRTHGQYQIILRKSNNRINFFPSDYQIKGYNPVLVVLDEWKFFKQVMDEEEERIYPFALFQQMFPKALVIGLTSTENEDKSGPYRPYHWSEEAWNNTKKREVERGIRIDS